MHLIYAWAKALRLTLGSDVMTCFSKEKISGLVSGSRHVIRPRIGTSPSPRELGQNHDE